jgi:probable HAF family extracellular repeat protein
MPSRDIRAKGLLGAIVVAGLASCGESSIGGPRAESLTTPLAIVSEPVPAPGVTSGISAALASARVAASSLVFVSLPPNTVPGGVSVKIHDVAPGVSITVPMLNGGLDPTPVSAAAGDTVRLEATDNSGIVTAINLAVPSRRRPAVVRTHPPKKKTDVPLNTRITIVFSEPIDPASLGARSVQLLRGGVPVPGTVALQRGSTVSAEFVPASRLDPETEYHLLVTQGVRDLDGDRLEALVEVEFTTGTETVASAVSLTLRPNAVVLAGDTVHLATTLKDAAGNVLNDRPLTVSSSDPTVAVAWAIDTRGIVAGVAEGLTTITVTSEGLTAFALLQVDPPESSPFAATDLGTLGGASSEAYGINDVGEIVGWASITSGRRRAFLRTASGAMVDLGTLGGNSSQAEDVNNGGQVVGSAADASGRSRPFLWTPSSPDHTLGAMVPLGTGEGIARAINNRGQVIGRHDGVPVIWTGPNVMVTLGSLGGFSEAQGINDDGVVVGYSFDSPTPPVVQYAVRWVPQASSDGVPTWRIEVVTDQQNSSASDVNATGDVAGSGFPCDPAQPPCYARAYLWRGTETVPLPHLAREPSGAFALSNAGDAVGWSYNDRSRQRAVLWKASGEVVPLGLLRAASATDAQDINAAGQIVGMTAMAGSGARRATLWTRR